MTSDFLHPSGHDNTPMQKPPENLRIVFVHGGCYVTDTGVARSVSGLANALGRAGERIHVCTSQSRNIPMATYLFEPPVELTGLRPAI